MTPRHRRPCIRRPSRRRPQFSTTTPSGDILYRQGVYSATSPIKHISKAYTEGSFRHAAADCPTPSTPYLAKTVENVTISTPTPGAPRNTQGKAKQFKASVILNPFDLRMELEAEYRQTLVLNRLNHAVLCIRRHAEARRSRQTPHLVGRVDSCLASAEDSGHERVAWRDAYHVFGQFTGAFITCGIFVDDHAFWDRSKFATKIPINHLTSMTNADYRQSSPHGK